MQINDDTFTSLLHSLSTIHHPSLTHLSLEGNTITDEGLTTLSSLLLPRLEVLNLNENSVGPSGVEKVARAMREGILPGLRVRSGGGSRRMGGGGSSSGSRRRGGGGGEGAFHFEYI